jgi:hypothetical protein
MERNQERDRELTSGLMIQGGLSVNGADRRCRCLGLIRREYDSDPNSREEEIVVLMFPNRELLWPPQAPVF